MFATNRILRPAACAAFAALSLLLLPNARAVNGGEEVDPKTRAPYETTGAMEWKDGPHLIEPCTAVLLCNKVILTVNHCVNFGAAGEMYFTLAPDVNALPGGGTRYERTEREYKRKDQKTTARLDRNSITYGTSYRTPMGLMTGIALMKFQGDDELPGLPYLSLAAADFELKQDTDKDVWTRGKDNFLKPGKDATLGSTGGYGDAEEKRKGAGILKKGTMPFITWVEPTKFEPQGTNKPAKLTDPEAFLIQFTRKRVGTSHGCPGDSGGPLLTGDDNRLTGNLDFITDNECKGKDLPGGLGNFNTYVSLLVPANRKTIADYMAANCTDKRTIDLKTGDNKVVKEEEKKDEEKNECVASQADELELTDEEHLEFLTAWMLAMEEAFPGLKMSNIADPLGPQHRPQAETVVCPSATPTAEPTEEPTVDPTFEPTEEPTVGPTAEPTVEPTFEPTVDPTPDPTAEPTDEPTAEPTTEPTIEPTTEPTVELSVEPTVEPTAEPTQVVTIEPTAAPTDEPTAEPTAFWTFEPTAEPSAEPTEEPTAEPTNMVTFEPTPPPTPAPTATMQPFLTTTTTGTTVVWTNPPAPTPSSAGSHLAIW